NKSSSSQMESPQDIRIMIVEPCHLDTTNILSKQTYENNNNLVHNCTYFFFKYTDETRKISM
ncbi:Os03g0754300, partial [Oryza sativa Japonica Group]